MEKIPSDLKSLANRGYWLGWAFAKASLRDLQTLLKSLGLPEMAKPERNRARLELEMLYLGKCSRLIGPLMQERFPALSEDSIVAMSGSLMEGAVEALISLINQGERDDIAGATKRYLGADRTAFFIARLVHIGIEIPSDKMIPAVFDFEATIIDTTILTTLLDGMAMPQQQIDSENNAFRKQISRAQGNSFIRRALSSLGFRSR